MKHSRNWMNRNECNPLASTIKRRSYCRKIEDDSAVVPIYHYATFAPDVRKGIFICMPSLIGDPWILNRCSTAFIAVKCCSDICRHYLLHVGIFLKHFDNL